MCNHYRLSGRRCNPLVRALLCLCCLCPGGCPVAPTESQGDAIPEPTAPDYLQVNQALGIWQALENASKQLPSYLNNVPGVDGSGPFEVETLVDVPFKQTGNTTLTLNIHRPLAGDGQLRRAVVLYMGGGFIADVDYTIIEVWAQYMASRGFVTFNARQRLITEPGVDLLDALSDGMAAVRFVVAEGPRFGADPERIGVLGRSSGGQLALLTGMHPDPELFRQPGDADAPVAVRAIVDIFGPIDYRPLATGEQFTLIPREEIIAAFGGTPEQVPELYATMSPLSYVRPGLPPTMIVHGLFDTTIPAGQSVMFADLLEDAGNIVRREFYAHTGHVLGWGLFNNDGFGRAMTQVIRFFEEFM